MDAAWRGREPKEMNQMKVEIYVYDAGEMHYGLNRVISTHVISFVHRHFLTHERARERSGAERSGRWRSGFERSGAERCGASGRVGE